MTNCNLVFLFVFFIKLARWDLMVPRDDPVARHISALLMPLQSQYKTVCSAGVIWIGGIIVSNWG